MTPLFDLRALFVAVNAERERQGLSWAALARRIGVAASTLRRFAQADDSEADGVLAAVRWLGTTPEDYVEGDAVMGSQLGAGDGSHVRVDMDLVAAASGDSRGANGRTRTSIQRLVDVAQRSRQPVASLTRLTEV